MTVDADGDQVICRYGTIPRIECSTCIQPTGFYLDEVCKNISSSTTCELNLFFVFFPNLSNSYCQGTCVLHYRFTKYIGIYGFELVVEDFPRSTITLTSKNGTQTTRFPLTAPRRKRAVYGTTAIFPMWWTTTAARYATTTPPTTPPTNPWWTPTQAPSTTTSSPQALPATTTQPTTQTTTTATSTTSTNAPLQTTTRRQYPAPLSKLPLQFSILGKKLSGFRQLEEYWWWCCWWCCYLWHISTGGYTSDPARLSVPSEGAVWPSSVTARLSSKSVWLQTHGWVELH